MWGGGACIGSCQVGAGVVVVVARLLGGGRGYPFLWRNVGVPMQRGIRRLPTFPPQLGVVRILRSGPSGDIWRRIA